MRRPHVADRLSDPSVKISFFLRFPVCRSVLYTVLSSDRPNIHSVGLLHRQLLGLAADSGPHGSVNGTSPPSGITAQRRQPEGDTVLIEKIRSL
jgi:hypothetical protein